MRALAVHHVALSVADLAEAISFYTGTLGLTVRADRPSTLPAGAWLDAGGQQIHLVPGRPPEACGQHVAILVDDLDAAIADVRGAGVEVTDPVPIGTAHQAFLRDPSGNAIELHGPRSISTHS